MHFQLPSIAAILAVAGLASATPLVQERQTDTTSSDRYNLQTKVVGNNHSDCGSNKDGLYVYSYHTGAGLGDVGLSSNKTWAWQAYLNGSELLFDYPTGNTPYPWPFNIVFGEYQGFYLTTISISGSVSNAADGIGYFFNSSGLQTNYTETAGWLACDWWHGVPQLFSLSSFYGPLPSTCSQVELVQVAV